MSAGDGRTINPRGHARRGRDQAPSEREQVEEARVNFDKVAHLAGIGGGEDGVQTDVSARTGPAPSPRDRRGPRRWRRWLGLVILLAIVGVVAYWKRPKEEPVRYVTAPVIRGTVAVALTATGTVNPVTVVEVGTYVSGTIARWYCDYNTPVTIGQLCAQIDPRPFLMVVDQAKANHAVARAQLVKDQVNLAYAKTTYERDYGLLQRGIVSQATVDSDKSAYEQAQAQITYDGSAIQERQAELNAAQVNLGYTKIISPVNGTVVSRNIEIGQTVAASFQTPILFLIATDLTKMQVDTNVSEADIGGVKVGDRATFTVQAFPHRVFQGRVRQVRQAPVTVQNVVTYDVVVSADNLDGSLKPGMTATTRVIKEERDGVLTVPAQALRFRPEGLRAARSASATPRRAAPPVSAAGDGAPRGRVWVLRAGQLAAVPVTVGLDDGTSVEIADGDLQVGQPVIVAEASSGARAGVSQKQSPPGFFRPGGR